MKNLISSTLLALSLAGAFCCHASAQPVQIPGRGNDVITFPNGEASWADRVFSFGPGSPAADPAYSVPDQAIGRPDVPENGGKASTSLGRGGSIVLEFVDNRLIDVEGYDLYIFEVGPEVEDTLVEISENGSSWIEVGTVTGSTSYVDIGPVSQPGQQFRFVRLTDDPNEGGRSGRYVGADIDAIGAIGSISGQDIQDDESASNNIDSTPDETAMNPPGEENASRGPEGYCDAVSFYLPGSGVYTVGNEFPQSVVGSPDQQLMGGNSLRLGEGGSVVVLMSKYRAVNAPGDDILVYGEIRGPIRVDVSDNLTDWTTLGHVKPNQGRIDLGNIQETRYIRLVEEMDGTFGSIIDAVGVSKVRRIR